MKKLYILLLAVLLPLAGFSQQAAVQRITDREASEIATSVLGKQVKKALPAQATQPQAAQQKGAPQEAQETQETQAPFYQIYTGIDGNGFVIVSLDPRAPKVIGYGEGKADPDNLPPQLRRLLEKTDSVLMSVPVSATAIPHSSWSHPTPKARKAGSKAPAEGEVLLNTAPYGQDAPYNRQTPRIDEHATPTGCVATAMSIIMKYHNWPETCQKYMEYYDPGNQTYVPYEYSQITFDWTKIKEEYVEDNYTEEEADEVSKLMFAAGVAVETQWRQSESGASNLQIMMALNRFFKYSADAVELYETEAGIEEFMRQIKENIDRRMPVLYYGVIDSTLGHAFVVDGYNADNFIHVNWGWNGSLNGFFNINEMPVGGPGSHITNDYGMIGSLHPAYTEEIWSDCYMVPERYTVDPVVFPYMTEISVSVKDIEKGVPFDLVGGSYLRHQLSSGLMGVLLVDKDMNIKEVVATHPYIKYFYGALVRTSTNFSNCVVNVDLEEGDSLYFAIKENDESNPTWKFIKKRNDVAVSVPVKGNTPKFCDITWTLDSGTGVIFKEFISDQTERICSSEDINQYYGKLLKGRQIRGEEVSENLQYTEGEASAFVINGSLVGISDDIYPAMFQFAPIDSSYEIKLLCIRKAERQTRTINVETPGSLESLVGENPHKIWNLTLTGTISYSDLIFIRDHLFFLHRLDLRECSIAAEGIYPARFLPEASLAMLTRLEVLLLPSRIDSIGDYACAGSPLKNIEIPGTVKAIGNLAFANAFKAIVALPVLPPRVKNFSFSMMERGAILFVPQGSKENYAGHPVWGRFKEIREDETPEIEDFDTVINGIRYSLVLGHAEIAGADAATCPREVEFDTVIVRKGKSYPVTTLRYRAFLYDTNLKKVTVLPSVTDWGEAAFSCSKLEEAVINAPIEFLPLQTFENNRNLRSLILPESLKGLGQYSITFCQLEHIRFSKFFSGMDPNENVVVNAFLGHKLKAIELDPDNPYFTLVDGVMYTKDMKTLVLYPNGRDEDTVRVAEGVENMYWGMFYDNKRARFFQLPSTLKEIPLYTFGNTEDDMWLVIPDSVVHLSQECMDAVPRYLTVGKGVCSYVAYSIRGHFLERSSVYLLNETPVAVDVLFMCEDGGMGSIDFYSPYTYANFMYAPQPRHKYRFYVPGACTDLYPEIIRPQISEMWNYKVNRDSSVITIIPKEADLQIESVWINGREYAPTTGHYRYDNSEKLDVTVNYRLHGRQRMSTHYDSVFNACLADSVIKKVQSITWENVPDTLKRGEQLELQAISSSGLPVEYAVVEGEEYCVINGTVFTAQKEGIVKLMAVQNGNVEYEGAAPQSRTIVINGFYAPAPEFRPVSGSTLKKGDTVYLWNALGSANIFYAEKKDQEYYWSYWGPIVIEKSDTLYFYAYSWFFVDGKEYCSDTVCAVYYVESMEYTITVLSNDTTMGTVTGGGTYMEDEKVLLEATPKDGYKFVKWSDGTEDYTANPFDFLASRDVTYTAFFERDEVVEPTYYTITVLSNDTAMGTVSGGGTYMEDEKVLLEATPKDGYKFVKWSDGTEDYTANPFDFLASRDVTYTAFFEKNTNVGTEPGAAEPGGIRIYTRGGTIVIEGKPAPETVTVYNAIGQRVYKGCDNIISGLPRGLYIVRTGTAVRKVVL